MGVGEFGGEGGGVMFLRVGSCGNMWWIRVCVFSGVSGVEIL